MKNIIGIVAAVCIMTSCNNDAEKQAQIQAQRTVDSLKTEMAKQHIVDSMNAVTAQQALEQQETTDAQNSRGGTSNTYNTSNTHYGSAPATKQPSTAEPKKKKKGWSAKAKGAVIGAGAGAITGAMVDKKKGEGAVVGGIIGAAAGFGAGAIIDKKQKDKEAAEKDK